MKDKTKPLPPPIEDVWVTYKKVFGYGHYGMEKRTEIVTKRGFYCPLFKTFSIPPEYREFNGKLLPHGFGGDHLPMERIIDWNNIKQ